MPDGTSIEIDLVHMLGGTKRGKVLSGGHSQIILDLIEKGILIDVGPDYSKLKDIPVGVAIVKWNFAGKEYEMLEAKYSTILKGTHKERAKMIKEAWDDVLKKWDEVVKESARAGGKISITGTAKNGIDIEFKDLNIQRATLVSSYPLVKDIKK